MKGSSINLRVSQRGGKKFHAGVNLLKTHVLQELIYLHVQIRVRGENQAQEDQEEAERKQPNNVWLVFSSLVQLIPYLGLRRAERAAQIIIAPRIMNAAGQSSMAIP